MQIPCPAYVPKLLFHSHLSEAYISFYGLKNLLNQSKKAHNAIQKVNFL